MNIDTFEHVMISVWRMTELRKLNGFTTEYIAGKIGLSDKEYIDAEAGEYILDAHQLFILCELYDVTPNYMLGFCNEPQSLRSLKRGNVSGNISQ